jgi:hypothetical protein
MRRPYERTVIGLRCACSGSFGQLRWAGTWSVLSTVVSIRRSLRTRETGNLLNDFQPSQIGFVLLEIGARAEMRGRTQAAHPYTRSLKCEIICVLIQCGTDKSLSRVFWTSP